MWSHVKNGGEVYPSIHPSIFRSAEGIATRGVGDHESLASEIVPPRNWLELDDWPRVFVR